jgi:hypothetical protein
VKLWLTVDDVKPDLSDLCVQKEDIAGVKAQGVWHNWVMQLLDDSLSSLTGGLAYQSLSGRFWYEMRRARKENRRPAFWCRLIGVNFLERFWIGHCRSAAVYDAVRDVLDIQYAEKNGGLKK